MDGDHVTVLDTKVVADNTVDACTTVVELLVGKDDKHGILSLLAANKDGITAEKL